MRTVLSFRISFLIGAALAFAADADPSAKYAVMSLIGDSITVVANHPVTGSLIDRNGHQMVELPPEAIDNVALSAADDAIKKKESHASTVLMEVSSASLRDRQSQLIEGDHLTDPVELSGALKGSGASYLVLISKHRADAALRTDRDTLGNGTLYGLGFYIDRNKKLFLSDGEGAAHGYLAPYAYFNIYLVDVGTSKVLGERTIMASRIISNAKNDVSSDPWDILNGDQKIKVLDEMVRRQITKAMPDLIP